MKKSMTAASTVVFFVAAAGCFPGVTGVVDVRARVDSADFGAGATPVPVVATTVDPGDLAREIVKALPTAAPTATPSPTATPAPTPTPPPGERLREGVWTRPRQAGDPTDGPGRAEGSRLSVKLTGKKNSPLVRRTRTAPDKDDGEWYGSGFLGLVPEEDEWLLVEFDEENGWFRIIGSKTTVIISEEAFLTE